MTRPWHHRRLRVRPGWRARRPGGWLSVRPVSARRQVAAVAGWWPCPRGAGGGVVRREGG